jgi:hypothetical protein
MATIKVYRPDVITRAAATIPQAPREPVPEGAVLTLIDNGKPRARDLLQRIAERLRTRLPIGRVDVFSKPTAAKAIDADEARMLAARSHLVISGLGD